MAITYNYQNLPVLFSFYQDDADLDATTRIASNPKSEVEMVYNGSGKRLQKLERIYNDDGTIKVKGKLYSGPFVYEAEQTFTSNEDQVLNYELDYVNLPGGDGRIDYEDGVEQERYAYLKDHLGSTRMTVNEDGEIVQQDLYTAYGEEISLGSVGNEETTEKFTGKELDKEGATSFSDGIQLQYFGWRYYDPVVGLWTSVDPKEQFWSGYSYSGNFYNPINSFDPDGLALAYFIISLSKEDCWEEIAKSLENEVRYAKKILGEENVVFKPQATYEDFQVAFKDLDAIIIVESSHGMPSGNMFPKLSSLGHEDAALGPFMLNPLPNLKLLVNESCHLGEGLPKKLWNAIAPNLMYYLSFEGAEFQKAVIEFNKRGKAAFEAQEPQIPGKLMDYIKEVLDDYEK